MAALLALGCAGNAVAPGTPTSAAETPLEKLADAVATGSRFDFLAVDGDAVWATDYDASKLVRLDAATARVRGEVKLPAGACKTIAVGFGAVWVARCTERSILRIDREQLVVTASYPVDLSADSEAMVAAGEGAIWVVGDRCTDGGVLLRIDPASGRVVAETRVALGSRGIALTEGAVWVTSPMNDVVTRVDTRTNRATAEIKVGWAPRFIAADRAGVWTLNQGRGQVVRIDPATAAVVARIDAGVRGLGGDIAAADGAVWVRGTDVLLVRIDAATNRVAERYGPPMGSGGVRAQGGRVWVSAHDVQKVFGMPAPR